MMILVSIGAFLVAIGLLVTVHEFGHYWVARRCGVKVLRFSIGFGRPLKTWVAGRDRTEYVIAAIPMGGYVKMVDERDEPVPSHDLPRAFNRQNVWRRIAIVAAGPMANFLFAILAFWLMFMVGVTGARPLIGSVDPHSLAARGGFESGEEILQVENRRTPTWELVALSILDHGLSAEPVRLLVRTSHGQEVWRSLDISDRRTLLGEGQLLENLGIRIAYAWSEPILGEILPGSAGDRAGLRQGDRILSVDGMTIGNWSDWVAYVQERPNTRIELLIERQGQRLDLDVFTDARREAGREVGLVGSYPYVDEDAQKALQTIVRHGPLESLLHGVERTWNLSVLTLRVMWRLITGEAAVSNIAGPVGIAEYAGVSAVIGLAAFLGFLGMISISLGIINLMPIPMLDGGHLVYYVVEIIKGSPVSATVEAVGQRIGIMMIAMLMGLALFNDFMRILS